MCIDDASAMQTVVAIGVMTRAKSVLAVAQLSDGSANNVA